MKKFIIVLSSIALLGLFAVPGFTQGHRHWGGGTVGMGGPGMMIPFMLKKLNLSDDQRAQVDQIMAKHRPNFQKYFADMEAAHEGLTGKLFTPGALTASDVSSQTAQ